jgi:hypothetical protein
MFITKFSCFLFSRLLYSGETNEAKNALIFLID